MINVFFGSHNDIIATVTDEVGDPVTAAVVRLTVKDRDGVTAVDNVLMTDNADGTYTYRVSPEELTRREHRYTYSITAVSASDVDRFSEGFLFTSIDIT